MNSPVTGKLAICRSRQLHMMDDVEMLAEVELLRAHLHRVVAPAADYLENRLPPSGGVPMLRQVLVVGPQELDGVPLLPMPFFMGEGPVLTSRQKDQPCTSAGPVFFQTHEVCSCSPI